MAKRHPVSRRTRPPQTPATEDVLVEKTLVLSGWARQNRQALTLGAIVAVAIVFGTIYYFNYRGQHLNQAAIELERARQNVAFGDTATATVELAQYLQSFGNTPFAAEASLLLGELYLATDRPAEAAETLQSSARPSDALGIQAMFLMAKAREQQGQLEEAERILLQLADRADLRFQVEAALADAARILQGRGDPSGAAALYERLLDELAEDAQMRPVYEMRLQEARTRAST